MLVKEFIKKNIWGIGTVIIAVMAVTIGLGTRESARQFTERVREELEQKDQELAIQFDTEDERLENQILKLQKEGFVEKEEFAGIAEKARRATVLITESGSSFLVGESPKSGSGFLVSSEGQIVTARHVVDEIGNSLTVTLADGKRFPAKIISKDDKLDIAIIKIEGAGFPFLKTGHFDNIAAGEDVGFVGYVLSGGTTKTLIHRGVVSSKTELADGVKFFTINAFVNHGNSGGPVFSAKTGRVLGVLSSRQREATESRFLKLPANYKPAFSLGGVDPLGLSVDLYNKTLATIGDVSQIGIGIVYPINPTVVLP